MESQVATGSKAQKHLRRWLYDHYKLYRAVVTFGALGGLCMSAMLDVNMHFA